VRRSGFVGRRPRGRQIVVPVAAAVGAYLLPGAAPVAGPVAAAFALRRRVERSAGIALTFDDGPHADGTPAVLDVLAEMNVTATFFLVGEQVEREPELVAKIVAAGHEVGIHCFRHRSLLRLSPRETSADIMRAARTIAAIGARPRLYRPPYGVANLAAVAVARRHGWTPLLWSKDGRDWQARATPASIAGRILRRISAGDVILLHDADHYTAPGSWRATARALADILRQLSARGFPVGSYREISANTGAAAGRPGRLGAAQSTHSGLTAAAGVDG